MDISGASALVTGGASGLGGAISRLLAELGAKVTVVDLQDEKGEAMAAEIGGKYAHADVTNTEEVEAAVGHGERRRRPADGGQLRRHRLGPAHGRQGR